MKQDVTRPVAAFLWLLLTTMILFSDASTLQADYISSVKAASVSAMDFLIDLDGYDRNFETYTYEEYSTLLQSYDIPNHDYLKGEIKPKQILFAYYLDGDIGSWFEIHEYETPEDAEQEYQSQEPQYGSDRGRPIFNRYETEEWMFQKDRFLVFAFCSPGHGHADHKRSVTMFKDLLNDFIVNFMEVVSEAERAPPPVSFSGKVVWGIRPGDKIAWEMTKSSQYNTYSPKLHACEIMKISDDNLSILIRIPYERYEAYNQPGWAGKGARDDHEGIVYNEWFNISHYDYYWGTVDEGGLELRDAYHSGVLIYPLYMDGKYLIDMVESAINYLPETTVTESAETISGYGKTYSGSGYTPIETQWKDITVHKGTGIVTNVDWYYQDREYDVQASNSATLNSTNIILKSRLAYIPQENGSTGEDGASEDGDEATPTPTLTMSPTPENSDGASSARAMDDAMWYVLGVPIVTVAIISFLFLRRRNRKDVQLVLTCIKCGGRLEPGTIYCPSCGNKVS